MRKILLLSMLICLVLPSSAYAHVLLQDSQRQMGTMLHVTPDDDPIAGEPSSLVFDIQDRAVNNDAYSFTLQILDSSEALQVIPISATGTIVSASHIFPAQGLYRVELRADPVDTSKQPLIFTHSQLISRGVTGTNSPSPQPVLAEIGLVASSCGLLILGILSWNNRVAMRK